MRQLTTIAALAGLIVRPGACRAVLLAAVTEMKAEMSYAPLYEKYSQYTMIPRPTYVNNLTLVDAYREVPGCVIECGVWRGGMIAGLAEVLGPDRDYAIFDSFEGLPPAQEIDGSRARNWQSRKSPANYYDNCCAPQAFVDQAMLAAGAKKVSIYAGWFQDTLKGYSPPCPIAVLRLDGDWYESTMTCLEGLFWHMAPGGLVIIDDYSAWDGCRRAVHDFLSRHKSPARILRWRNDVTYIQVPSQT
jgi:O-methyltransferase